MMERTATLVDVFPAMKMITVEHDDLATPPQRLKTATSADVASGI